MSPSNKPDEELFAGATSDELRLDCRKRAMDLLARREHSRAELSLKLRQRDFSDDIIIPVLDGLQADGLLADRRFAESLAVSRARRGRGPVRIHAELIQKGVSSEVVEQVLADCDCDWVELAQAVRVKKFGAAAPLDYEGRARQARFLTYRGFSSEQVQAALDMTADTD